MSQWGIIGPVIYVTVGEGDCMSGHIKVGHMI